MLPMVLKAFGIEDTSAIIEPYGSGLINKTWKVSSKGSDFILQKVNHHVFQQPKHVAHNIRQTANYLSVHFPEYVFAAPVISLNGFDLVYNGDEVFRLSPFIKNTYTINTVETASQAYEAAKQFGKFASMLSGLDAGVLKITIPHFHDLEYRYRHFLEAYQNGNKERIAEATGSITLLNTFEFIIDVFKKFTTDSAAKIRIMHHDAKINNVLFNEAGAGLCVIDLDTIMPGFFISDVGDMMRSYLSPAGEEEPDLTRIDVREDFYQAILQGYYEEMGDKLTSTEKFYFYYSGLFLTYMQALRFLTDYLENDAYYQISYPNHNLIRAKKPVNTVIALVGEKAETCSHDLIIRVCIYKSML